MAQYNKIWVNKCNTTTAQITMFLSKSILQFGSMIKVFQGPKYIIFEIR